MRKSEEDSRDYYQYVDLVAEYFPLVRPVVFRVRQATRKGYEEIEEGLSGQERLRWRQKKTEEGVKLNHALQELAVAAVCSYADSISPRLRNLSPRKIPGFWQTLSVGCQPEEPGFDEEWDSKAMDPTEEMLQAWETRSRRTVGKLLEGIGDNEYLWVGNYQTGELTALETLMFAARRYGEIQLVLNNQIKEPEFLFTELYEATLLSQGWFSSTRADHGDLVIKGEVLGRYERLMAAELTRRCTPIPQ